MVSATALLWRFRKSFPLLSSCVAAQKFQKTGVDYGGLSAEELRNKVKEGLARMKADRWSDFYIHSNVSFWQAMNMDKLDTIK
jgi:hypothetical protein